MLLAIFLSKEQVKLLEFFCWQTLILSIEMWELQNDEKELLKSVPRQEHGLAWMELQLDLVHCFPNPRSSRLLTAMLPGDHLLRTAGLIPRHAPLSSESSIHGTHETP